MALSGSYHWYPRTGYNFGLWVDWHVTQNAVGGYSDVTQDVYVQYDYLKVPARTLTSSINGTSETFNTAAIDENNQGTFVKTLLCSHTVRVNHNAAGDAVQVALSANWAFSYVAPPNNQYMSAIPASDTVTIDALDRNPPSITISAVPDTNSIALTVNSSVYCNLWEYSLDNSTWTTFSTTDGVSASTTITGLSAATSYTVYVRVRKTSNLVQSTSSTTVQTTGGNVLNSVATITCDASTVTMSINATVLNASFTHTFTIKDGNTTVTSISGVTLQNGANSITLSGTNRSALLNHIPNAKSFTASVVMTTYNGATSLGDGAPVTGVLVTTTAANSSPTFTNFTYSDTNSTITAVTGNNQYLVQGKSTLSVSASATTAKNGASITGYSAVIGSVSASSSTTTIAVGTVYSSGTVQLAVSAIDSRGYTTTVSKNVTVLEYNDIRITLLSVLRVNGVDAETNLSVNGVIYPLIVGSTNKNSVSYLRYRTKSTNASSYGSWTTVTPTQTDTAFSYYSNPWLSFDINYSYNVEFEVSDALSTYSEVFTVPQAIPLMSFRPNKVGIKNKDPQDSLDVNGGIIQNGVYIHGFRGTKNGIDANTLTDGGYYFITGASSSLHYPGTTNGMLEILSNNSNFVVQRMTLITGGVYSRVKNSGSWTSWISL